MERACHRGCFGHCIKSEKESYTLQLQILDSFIVVVDRAEIDRMRKSRHEPRIDGIIIINENRKTNNP